jgi:hypothetical protein
MRRHLINIAAVLLMLGMFTLLTLLVYSALSME